jgi:tetratricopeptide (TPR) repeat protein
MIFLFFAVSACAAPHQPSALPEIAVSTQDARKLVVDFEAGLAVQRVLESRTPVSSLDDVLDVLRTDQISRFPDGIAFAQTQDGIRARALEGQIELAWADAQVIVAEILAYNAGKLMDKQGAFQIGADLTNKVSQLAVIVESLKLMAREHRARGAELARDIILKAPGDYLGYRLIADYYRMENKWDAFEENLGKLEAANPVSNGLVFQRGVAALLRDKDPPLAVTFFKQALVKDPNFVRAQAFLVSAQDSSKGMIHEYFKLKGLSPSHQIVIIAGPFIEALRRKLRNMKVDTTIPNAVRHE